MKTRIMIFMCLFLLIAGGLFYITQRQQAPTGLATGDYCEIKGKITLISGSSDHMSIYVEEDTGSGKVLHSVNCYEDDSRMKVAMLAYQTQSVCHIAAFEENTYYREVPEKRLHQIYIERDDSITNADIVDEIKSAQSGINYVKNWLRWIWRYVYWTYRRVR